MLRGLADYRVIRPLARGGQAQTLLAIDTHLQRPVCIKLYKIDAGVAARRRAEAEAWKLARIHSPRVLDVFDVVAHGEDLALVTRYVPGVTLDDLLAHNGSLPAEEALAIATDVAAALACLRRERIVHGDVSARNVLLDHRGRAVLVDFGVSLFQGQAAQGYSVDALSPEQSRGAATDLRSDFFSLGILLHRMLTGAHPFFQQGAVAVQALQRGLRSAPPLPGLSADVREPLQTLLRSLLAASPADRPQSTFALREEFRQLRMLLPSPDHLVARVDGLQERRVSSNESMHLPQQLVRLPWQRKLKTVLDDYWGRGSAGARMLLLSLGLLPLLGVLLFGVMPGPCVLVEKPSLELDGSVAPGIPGALVMQEILTRALSQGAPRTLVLGRGNTRDDAWTIRAAGIHNVCVPETSMRLAVECVQGDCEVALRSRRGAAVRFDQLLFSQSVARDEFVSALQQMVRAQIPFIAP